MYRKLTLCLFAFAASSVAHAEPVPLTPPRTPIPRAVLRTAVQTARIHPDGATLFANQNLSRLELKSGTMVLFSLSRTVRWDLVGIANFIVYGKLGSGDDALYYLNARERKEVTGLLEQTRASFSPETNFAVRYDGATPGTLKKGVAAALAPTTRESRNYLVLQGLVGTLK